MLRRFYIFLITLSLVFSYCGFAYAISQTTSGKTASDIETELKQDVNAESTSFISSSEVYRWIDEAQKNIVILTSCLQGSVTTTLTAEQSSYDISLFKAQDVVAVRYSSGATSSSDEEPDIFLERLDIQDISRLMPEIGKPRYFTFWGDNLLFYPTPGTEQDGKSITYYYTKVPTIIDEGTDSIELPAVFDNAILLYCKAKFWEKDRAEDRASYYRNLFYQSIRQYMISTSRKLPVSTVR